MAQDLSLKLVLTAVDQGYTATLTDAEGKVVDFGEKAREVRNALLALAGIDIGVGIVKDLIEQADAYSSLTASIKNAVGPTQDYVAATNDVITIANDTRSSLDATAGIYEKVARNAAELNLNQAQVAEVTRLTSEAMQLGGQAAGTQADALTQLGQALGSGVLRGDEFNSVMEASPPLMQAVADGLGLPLGKLREWAEQGKLTADIVTNALLSQKNAIDQQFQNLPETVGQAITKLSNNFQVYVGQANQGVGATKILAEGVDFLANHLDSLDALMAGLAAGGVAKLGQGLYSQVTAFQAARQAATDKAAATVAAAQSELELATAASTAAEIQARQAASAQALAAAELEQAAAAQSATTADNAAVAAKERLGVATIALQQANAKSVAASLAMEEAQTRLATAQTAAASKAGLLTSAMNLLGGPTGVIMLVVTGLGLLVSAFSSSNKAMEDSGKKVDELRGKLSELDKARTQYLVQQEEQAIKAAQAEQTAATARVQNIESLIAKYKAEGTALEEIAAAQGGYFDSSEEIKRLEAEIVQARAALGDATDKLGQKQGDLAAATQHLGDIVKETTELTLAQKLEFQRAAEAAAKSESQIGSYGKTIAAVSQAEKAAADTAAELTKLLGDESSAYQAAADKAAVAAQTAQAEAEAKRQQAQAAQTYLDKLQAQLAIVATLSDAQQKALTQARENASVQQAAADAAQAVAHASQLEAAQLAGVADAHRQAGQAATVSKETLVQLRAEYDRLKEAKASPQQLAEALNALMQAEKAAQVEAAALGQEHAKSTAELARMRQEYQDAAAKVRELQSAQVQGKATQSEVNAAIAEQVRVLTALKTALEEAITAAENQSSAAQRHTSIAQAEIQVQIDQANAAKSVAQARNDSAAAARAETAAKDLAVKQSAVQIEAMKQELAALQQILALKQQQVQADGAVTLAEQAEIAALVDVITQKRLAIASGQAHAEQLLAEAEAARNASQSQQDYSTEIKSTNTAFLDASQQRNAAYQQETASIGQMQIAMQSLDGVRTAAFDVDGITAFTNQTQKIKDLIADAAGVTARLSESMDAAGSAASQAGIQMFGVATAARGITFTQLLQQASNLAEHLGTVEGQMAETARQARENLLGAIKEATNAIQQFAQAQQQALKDDALALEKLRAQGNQRQLEDINYREKIADLQADLEIAEDQNNRSAIAAIRQRMDLAQQVHIQTLNNLANEDRTRTQIYARNQAKEALVAVANVDLSRLDGSLSKISALLGGIAQVTEKWRSDLTAIGDSKSLDNLLTTLEKAKARS